MLIRTSLLALDQAARLQFNVGDGLDLWLDDRRLGARQDDRDISLRLTGEGIPEGLAKIHVRGQIGAIPIEMSFDPAPNQFFNHVWDGSSGDPAAPGTPANLVTELEVGWEMAEQFPRPHRIQWWRKPVVVGGIDLRSLGCGGITPGVLHHYDVKADILWRGDGSRVSHARAKNPRYLSRLKILPTEIGIADGTHAHVFDASGTFKRSLSTLKGHEVANARTDDVGRVISWTRSGHRYTIDRRNDNEALLRSPAGVWAVIDFDDRGRAIMVTDQDKSKAMLDYTETGGLSRIVDNAGLVTEIERDELGRIIKFSDSTGRQLDLIRTQLAAGSEVTVISAEGRETSHRNERLEDGTYVQSHSCCGASSPRVIEHRSLGPLGDEKVVRTSTGMVATTRRSTRSDKLRALEVSRTSIVSPKGRTLSIERRTERHRTGRTDELLTIGNGTSHKRLEPKTHTIISRTAEGRESTTKLNPGVSLALSVPGAGSMKIEFDDNGRPRRRDRHGEVMTYGYDQNGRLTWSDFERWRQHIHHDEQGRVNSIETPDGWLQIARDPAGRVVALKSPSDAVTTIGRRPDGAIESVTYPEVDGTTEVEQLLYDRDGLLIGHVFNDDHLVGYERDLAGRVLNVTAPGVKISSDYNETTGQLVEVASAGGDSIRFQYDGDLAWSEETMGRTPGRVERAFDHNHRVIARRVNGDHQVRIVRDNDDLVTTVGPLQIERSANAGLPVGLRLGGLTTTREFDNDGRLTKHATQFGKLALVFFGEEIERDDFGRISRITETSQGQERTIDYSYNDARRLETVTVDGQVTMSLSYDDNGNITELDRLGRTLSLEFDAVDRLIRVAGQTTEHDACGNFTGIGENGTVRGYRFDGLGRMVGSSDVNHDVTHVLDAIGRPIRISGSGAPVRLLWDGDRLAATLDEQANVDMRFIDSGRGPCPEALIRDGVEYLLVTDHLGSVRTVVDAQEGHVVQTIAYDALGRPTINTAPGWQPFGFAGGLHEHVGGVVRFQARTYDPFIGRFLSRDPLGFAGGQVNLYQYALGDPINNSDPTGLLVGPSGEVHVAKDEFLGKRPLSMDHAYLRSSTWTSGLKPVTTLGTLGRLLTRWTADSSCEDHACRALVAADQGCADTAIDDESPPDGQWTQTDQCFGDEWNSLNLTGHPGAWEFDAAAWDERPGIKDRLHRLAQMPNTIKSLRSIATDRVSTLTDGLFD